MKNFNNNFDESFKFNLDVLQKAKDLQRGGFNGFSFNLLGGFSGLYKILLWLVPTVFVGIGAFFVHKKHVNSNFVRQPALLCLKSGLDCYDEDDDNVYTNVSFKNKKHKNFKKTKKNRKNSNKNLKNLFKNKQSKNQHFKNRHKPNSYGKNSKLHSDGNFPFKKSRAKRQGLDFDGASNLNGAVKSGKKPRYVKKTKLPDSDGDEVDLQIKNLKEELQQHRSELEKDRKEFKLKSTKKQLEKLKEMRKKAKNRLQQLLGGFGSAGDGENFKKHKERVRKRKPKVGVMLKNGKRVSYRLGKKPRYVKKTKLPDSDGDEVDLRIKNLKEELQQHRSELEKDRKEFKLKKMQCTLEKFKKMSSKMRRQIAELDKNSNKNDFIFENIENEFCLCDIEQPYDRVKFIKNLKLKFETEAVTELCVKNYKYFIAEFGEGYSLFVVNLQNNDQVLISDCCVKSSNMVICEGRLCVKLEDSVMVYHLNEDGGFDLQDPHVEVTLLDAQNFGIEFFKSDYYKNYKINEKFGDSVKYSRCGEECDSKEENLNFGRNNKSVLQGKVKHNLKEFEAEKNLVKSTAVKKSFNLNKAKELGEDANGKVDRSCANLENKLNAEQNEAGKRNNKSVLQGKVKHNLKEFEAEKNLVKSTAVKKSSNLNKAKELVEDANVKVDRSCANLENKLNAEQNEDYTKFMLCSDDLDFDSDDDLDFEINNKGLSVDVFENFFNEIVVYIKNIYSSCFKQKYFDKEKEQECFNEKECSNNDKIYSMFKILKCISQIYYMLEFKNHIEQNKSKIFDYLKDISYEDFKGQIQKVIAMFEDISDLEETVCG